MTGGIEVICETLGLDERAEALETDPVFLLTDLVRVLLRFGVALEMWPSRDREWFWLSALTRRFRASTLDGLGDPGVGFRFAVCCLSSMEASPWMSVVDSS